MQRPVFYAIGIIITAYMPIFTLQRVEGRLFKPMAWTVAFALVGALIFSMLLAPVLASFLSERRQGMAQPADDRRSRASTAHARHGDPLALRHRRRSRSLCLWRHSLARQPDDRLRISAAPRRRRHLGPRHARAQHRTHRRHASGQPGARHPRLLSRSHQSPPARSAVPTTAPTPPASSTPNISST